MSATDKGAGPGDSTGESSCSLVLFCVWVFFLPLLRFCLLIKFCLV